MSDAGERQLSDYEQWSAVDRYVSDRTIEPDPVLDEALAANAAAGLPAIDVTATQGKLLSLFVQMLGAHRVLEIGALGGYSTIWLGRALPADGRLITLESNPLYAGVARENVERAGLSDVVEVRVGQALDTLPQIAVEDGEPFDVVFIDADKANTPAYFEWALKLSRPGTLIVADNVIREGAVLDSDSEDPSVAGIRRFFELVADEPRVTATAIQTVGAKGYDGFAFALVTGE